MKTNQAVSIVAVCAGVLLSMASNAAVVTVENGGANVYYPYTVSSTDLINGMTGTLAGSALYGSSAVKMTDGIFFEVPSDRGNTAYTLTPANNSTLTYTLGAAYNLSSIAFYSASGSGQTRSQQNWTIGYNTDGGASFTTLNLGSWMTDVNNISNQNTSVKVSVAFTGAEMQGIQKLQFTFLDTGVGAETMYREVDVFGAVPEPASLALLGLGAMALLRRRR
jgi:hypothetical protein